MIGSSFDSEINFKSMASTGLDSYTDDTQFIEAKKETLITTLYIQ
jgi:hypothetical protein